MGLRAAARAGLARLAAGAPPRVFVMVGRGGREAAENLALDPRLRLVDSPRAAEVLLAVGGAVARLLRPALRVHDQAARPRATVWWAVGADGDAWPGRTARLAARFEAVERVGEGEDPVAAVLRCHRELVMGRRRSDPEVLPDEEPAEWRGVGPHGQGGEGMMGGVPYGRPMAHRAPARDGLELDRLPVRLGPFFPHLPPGLVLHVKLQGDVFQEVTVDRNPFPPPVPAGPFVAALHGRVPVVALEVARARHHLGWLARTLRLHGLAALGERAGRLGLDLRPETAAAGTDAIRRLERLLRRTRTLRWATRGVGRLERDRLAGMGPVARAAGLADDARAEEAVYRELGFEPVVRAGDAPGGDAWDRLAQRLAEAVQALELAGRAEREGRPVVGPVAAVEAPRGRLVAGREPPAARLLALVPDLLAGLEWGDALAALASLDLDLEEAAVPRVPVAARVSTGEATGEASGEGGDAEDTGDELADDGEEEAA